MSRVLEKNEKRQRRHKRVRAKVKGTAERPRLSVFRSSKHLYAQLIDDEAGRTIVAAADREIKIPKQKKPAKPKKTEEKLPAGRTQVALLLGKLIAEKAKKLGISKAVFDRGGYQYHGMVKAIADGAREGGLQF